MFDCNDDLTAYHDDEVTLPQEERDEMRARRDSNRTRLKAGLDRNEKPKPVEIVSQGSYAMKTMVQHPKRDYDIDDGAYFHKADLVGPRGGEMTPLEAREMVRDALADDRFKRAPEVRAKCVRVHYNEGYHLDVPVYRRSATTDAGGKELIVHELAGSAWTQADARAVTAWFDQRNQILSPDKDNGRQFRRVVRLAKRFARSRASWDGRIATGIMITALCSECFVPASARDDQALRRTLEAVRDRLKADLLVRHPVLADETITEGTADPKAVFLRDTLEDHLEDLKPIDESDCDHREALNAWGDFFDDVWFRERPADPDKSGEGRALVFGAMVGSRPAFDKRGGGRYA